MKAVKREIKLFAGNSDTNTTKQKAMVVIVPVLFVVLLIFVFKGGVFGTSVPNMEAGRENKNSAVVPAELDNQIDWEIPEAYPTTLRDPMQLGPVVTGTNKTGTNELVRTGQTLGHRNGLVELIYVDADGLSAQYRIFTDE